MMQASLRQVKTIGEVINFLTDNLSLCHSRVLIYRNMSNFSDVLKENQLAVDFYASAIKYMKDLEKIKQINSHDKE